MRLFACICALCLLSSAAADSLKERLVKGHPGDYAVTAQGGIYTVLLIRSIAPESVVLEEICIPEVHIEPDRVPWKRWVESRAPGNTSWVAYEIDLKTDQILESFSYSRQAWLCTEDPNSLLTKLLALSLQKIPETRRKKIGPAPAADEIDHRSLWYPPVVLEGKKIDTTAITPYDARWPNDGSFISGCEINLYFTDFPFPYWIQVKSPHYTAAIRTIDSGRHLNSPMPPLPQRPPEFVGQATWDGQKITLCLKCSANYGKLELFALDLTEEKDSPIPLSTTPRRKGSLLQLEIAGPVAKAALKTGHTYRFLLVPGNSTRVVAESDLPFLWKPTSCEHLSHIPKKPTNHSQQ